MFIHNVFFWLKEDLDPGAVQEFENGLDELTREENASAGYSGKPIPSDRSVVDGSYSYAIVLIFPDIDAHNRYQVGIPHQIFLDNNSSKWKKIVVYDFKQ